MKVLWFSNTPGLGAEYIGLKIAGGGWLKSLDKELQNEVELNIAFHFPKPLKPFEYGRTNYFPIVPLKWKRRMFLDNIFNKVYDKEYEEEYSSLINEIKPDIIHIHGTENPFGCIIDKVKEPVVVSIQGNITVCQNKFFSGIDSKYLNIKSLDIKEGAVKAILKESFRSKYKRLTKLSVVERKNLLKTRYVIGRTDWDRRVTSTLAPISKYFYCSEILRDAFYLNSWTKAREECLIIHSTSGDNYYKGFETICQCVSELNKLDINFKWQVAGIKESDLIVKIVKKKLGTSYPESGLLLLGTLNEDELVKNLLGADIFVMASHIENSPNNLCEAMILGLPCIATFAGGTASLLKDGEDGILIQDGDPWAMAGAILELFNDEMKCQKFSANARNKALIRHNKSKIVSDLITIYEKIIS